MRGRVRARMRGSRRRQAAHRGSDTLMDEIDINDDITGVPEDLASPEMFLDEMEAEMLEISEDIDAPEY